MLQNGRRSTTTICKGHKTTNYFFFQVKRLINAVNLVSVVIEKSCKFIKKYINIKRYDSYWIKSVMTKMIGFLHYFGKNMHTFTIIYTSDLDNKSWTLSCGILLEIISYNKFNTAYLIIL